MSADAPSLKDQILAAELWALGLKDWLERFAGGRRRPEHEVVVKRRHHAAAIAVVATLRGLDQAEMAR